MKFLNIFIVITVITSFNLSQAQAKKDVQELDLNADIMNRIYKLTEKIYVDEVDKQKIFENAIKGMLNGLDPHSDFLKPKEQKNLMEHSSGKFGGIGIVINKKDDFIEIISPIDDTPGYRAGLKSGDIIIKINDKIIRKISLEDSVDLMRGKPGTKVRLTISRKNKSPFEVNIIRDTITIVSAKGYLLEKDLGYIRIASFQDPTADLVLKTIKKLNNENKNNLKSIIIDLRNNPGGLITSATNISDIFLNEKKLIVYTKGRTKDSKQKYFSKKPDLSNGAKIVVLVNEGSASASEILAGALQDHRRAVIIGTKTFGKASVQSVIPLKGGYGIKLTIARYYTPNGRSIQAKGIVPDIELQDLEIKEKDDKGIKITESNYNNHLKADDEQQQKDKEDKEKLEEDIQLLENTTKENKKNQEKNKEKQKSIDALNKDYFVRQAINVLKVLNLQINK